MQKSAQPAIRGKRGERGHVAVKPVVLRLEPHHLTHQRVHALQLGRRERRMLSIACAAGKQLDPEDAGRVGAETVSSLRPAQRHADVILLPADVGRLSTEAGCA